MDLEQAVYNNAAEVKDLLAECELPWEDILPEHLVNFLLARQDGQIIGVIGLEIRGLNALLRSLAVRPDHRGRGIASQLTKGIEEHARSRGVKALYLLTTTADMYFNKRDYQKIDRLAAPEAIQRTTEFQSICPVTAICMVKNL